MNFPKETLPAGETFIAAGDVYLEARHICINKNIAEKIFCNEPVVLSVFYHKDNTFLVWPANEDLFRNIHKGTQQMLKNKNAAGDKSISIEELMLDHDINTSNRDLEYNIEEALNILKVKL